MTKQMAENTIIEQPEANKVYLGHTLDLLRSWPDNFIDCVVTSPPYYGLRNYHTPHQIWDAVDGCKHKWGKIIKAQNDNRDPETKAAQGGQVGNNIKTADHSKINHGAFCSECNAWKGELGHEPDFRDFIRHLIQIFREIHRCLKPTGTVWVNLGDCYTGSGKGGHSKVKTSENWKPDYPQIGQQSRTAAVTKGKGDQRIPDIIAG